MMKYSCDRHDQLALPAAGDGASAAESAVCVTRGSEPPGSTITQHVHKTRSHRAPLSRADPPAPSQRLPACHAIPGPSPCRPTPAYPVVEPGVRTVPWPCVARTAPQRAGFPEAVVRTTGAPNQQLEVQRAGAALAGLLLDEPRQLCAGTRDCPRPARQRGHTRLLCAYLLTAYSSFCGLARGCTAHVLRGGTQRVSVCGAEQRSKMSKDKTSHHRAKKKKNSTDIRNAVRALQPSQPSARDYSLLLTSSRLLPWRCRRAMRLPR